ncbi:hypothetical protein FRB96_003465 [Tulasnella sp. 330]|nr:hypothetical protein FRB96_003465 [Tulasnella sp. 330]KAG8880980.1 hypothetical protein FRB97_000304 [Tulasnella sp. 331]KAG8888919.1 hypothetical protein FRB98_006461 [Tulasnella sp. 332]
MSAAPPAKKDSTTPGSAPPAESSEASKVPQLGALEEDDEFEEFPVEGKLDADASYWDDSETALAHLTKNTASSGDPSKPGLSDTLWEDNWDDDDIEDDFSKQLREELTKTSNQTAAAPADTVMS